MTDYVQNGKRSIFTNIGAHNYAVRTREKDDFYSTDPSAIDKLKAVFEIPHNVYECACGNGNLSRRLAELGHRVVSTDLIDRGYGTAGVDFLQVRTMPENCDCILTNPPFKFAEQFVTHALNLVSESGIVIMFLRMQFIEGIGRYKHIFRDRPPKYMFQFVARIGCYKNDDRTLGKSAMPFCFLVWDKADKTGQTILKWI